MVYQETNFNYNTKYGTWIDKRENQAWLYKQIYALARGGSQYAPIDYNFLLTDYGKNYFLISTSLQYDATPVNQEDIQQTIAGGSQYNIINAICSICSRTGYINQTPVVLNTANPPSIKIPMTLKSNGETIQMYLIPMDNYSYKYTQTPDNFYDAKEI